MVKGVTRDDRMTALVPTYLDIFTLHLLPRLEAQLLSPPGARPVTYVVAGAIKPRWPTEPSYDPVMRKLLLATDVQLPLLLQGSDLQTQMVCERAVRRPMNDGESHPDAPEPADTGAGHLAWNVRSVFRLASPFILGWYREI